MAPPEQSQSAAGGNGAMDNSAGNAATTVAADRVAGD